MERSDEIVELLETILKKLKKNRERFVFNENDYRVNR